MVYISVDNNIVDLCNFLGIDNDEGFIQLDNLIDLLNKKINNLRNSTTTTTIDNPNREELDLAVSYPHVVRLNKKIVTTKDLINISLIDVEEPPDMIADLDRSYCAICQDVILPTQQIVMGECLHPLHIDCMNSYLQQNYDKCPVCRKSYDLRPLPD